MADDSGYFESHEDPKPRTNQDALLEKFQDAKIMALAFVYVKNVYGFKTFFSVHCDDSFNSVNDAMNAEMIYLLSPAEDGK